MRSSRDGSANAPVRGSKGVAAEASIGIELWRFQWENVLLEKNKSAMSNSGERSSSAAERIVRELMGASRPEAWKNAVWPKPFWASRLPDILCDESYGDADLIDAFRLMKSECGLASAIQKHGLHALWAADKKEPARVVALGVYCFKHKRREFLSWLIGSGDISPEEKLPSGRSVMLDAVSRSSEYAWWLVENGASLVQLQKEVPEKSLYVLFAKHLYWDQWADKLCAAAVEAGIDPWERGPGGEYPIVEAMRLDEGAALWIMDRASGVDLGPVAIGEMLGAAGSSGCKKLEARLKALLEAQEIGGKLDRPSESDKKLAMMGRWAMAMAREGRLSVDGLAVQDEAAMEKMVLGSERRAEWESAHGLASAPPARRI